MSNPWIKHMLEQQFGGRDWTVMDYAGNNFALIKDFINEQGVTFMVEVHEYGASYWKRKEDTRLICADEYQNARDQDEEWVERSAESSLIFYRPDGEKNADLTEDEIICTLSDEILREIVNVLYEF